MNLAKGKTMAATKSALKNL